MIRASKSCWTVSIFSSDEITSSANFKSLVITDFVALAIESETITLNSKRVCETLSSSSWNTDLIKGMPAR